MNETKELRIQRVTSDCVCDDCSTATTANIAAYLSEYPEMLDDVIKKLEESGALAASLRRLTMGCVMSSTYNL